MDVLELKEDNINLFVDFQKDTVGLENDFSNRLAYKVFKKKMHLMLLNSEIIVLGAYNQTMDELMGLVQGGPDGYKNELHSELYSWAFKLLLFNPLHWISVKNQKLVWQKVKKKLFRKKTERTSDNNYKTFSNPYRLQSLYVHENHRGKKVAQILVSSFTNCVLKTGNYDAILVSTRINNYPAQKVYTNLNFNIQYKTSKSIHYYKSIENS